ncbi:MAG: TolC family protein [Bacteroidota bacterium]
MGLKRILLLCCFSCIVALGVGQNSIEPSPSIIIDPIEGKLLDLSNLCLQKNPTILRQQLTIKQFTTNKQIATSTFDYQLNANLAFNRDALNLFEPDPRNAFVNQRINTNTLTLSSGVQRTFRTGFSAAAMLDYSRIGDNFPINRFNEEVGAHVSDNFTSLRFLVRQPLMRGKGRQIATANEKAAQIDIESQEYNLNFITSGELLNVVQSYWQYLSHHKQLEIYRENEGRIRQVLAVTKDLVNAEKKPAGDLVQVKADLTNKERQRLLAEQQLYNSRQNLGRFIGLNEQESEQIKTPKDPFPRIEDTQYHADLAVQRYLDLAHQHRADLKALVKSRDALEVLLSLAENNKKPQLDLTGFLTYGGADAGNSPHRFLSPFVNREGRNVQVGLGLNFLFPINNNFAEANLLNSKVAISDRQVILNNQIRNIELNVSIAFNNLQNAILALEKSAQSFRYYEEVFKNEQVKFQNGLTTLLNLILFQERLTFAQLDYIQSQQQVAQSIANLRYETGTLLPATKEPSALQDTAIFYQLPE